MRPQAAKDGTEVLAAAELLAQAEMLEENLQWMSDERYQASSRKQMHYQSHSSRERRRKRES